MIPRQRSLAILAAALLAGLLIAPAAADAAEDTWWTNFWGLALRGYDPVACFTEGAAVEGSDDYEIEWMDARWRFASQEHMQMFQANPEKYAPQFGGYCAWAVANGYTASIDPEAWKIVDGKLYLNYDQDIQRKWAQDIQGNIAKAEANWPGVIE